MKIGIPIDNLVLIELDDVDRVSKGGIVIVAKEEDYERQKMGKETGCIIAMGAHAFEGMEGHVPEIGDRVMFKRYSGTDATLEDDSIDKTKKVARQRIMHDKDIYMIIRDS